MLPSSYLTMWRIPFYFKIAHVDTETDIYAYSLGTSHFIPKLQIYIDKYRISIGLHHIRSKSQYLRYPILMISSVKPCNILTICFNSKSFVISLSFIFYFNFFCLHSCSFADRPFLQLQLRILLLEPLKDLRICWNP